jgi:hypothetical protein
LAVRQLARVIVSSRSAEQNYSVRVSPNRKA